MNAADIATSHTTTDGMMTTKVRLMNRLQRLVLTFACSIAFCSQAVAQPTPAITIEITVPKANLHAGSQIVGTVSQGQRFEVIRTNGDWLMIAAPVNNETRQIWVNKRDTKEVVATASPAVPSVRVVAPAEKPVADSLLPGQQMEKYLRVKTHLAELRLGTTVLMKLNQGEVLRIRDVQVPHYKVRVFANGSVLDGWLNQDHIEILDTAQFGPSLGEKKPSFITEPNVKVDWATGISQLTFPFQYDGTSKAPEFLIYQPFAPQTAILKGEVGDGNVSISQTVDDLLENLTPGTRSLWLETAASTNSQYYRLDLPTPQLKTELVSHRYDSIPDGPVVMIPVENVLPGFFAEYAINGGSWKPLPKNATDGPRWLDVYVNEGQASLRVLLPTSLGADRQYTAIRIRNVDNSISNVISAVQVGNTVDAKAIAGAEAAPALVDCTVLVPEVVILPYAEAIERLAQSGLKGKLVDDSTFRTQSPAGQEQSIVIRQGVPANTFALAGTNVLVTLENQGDDVLPDLVDLAGPIDTGDDLDFAMMDRELTSNSPLLDDSELTSLFSRAGIDAAIAEQSVTIPVTAKLGVNLSPTRTAERNRAAGSLRLLIESLLQQPNWADLPGPIGKTISTCISEHEEQLELAFETPFTVPFQATSPTVETMTPIAETIMKSLSIASDDAKRQGLAEDLVAFAEPRWSRTLLDRNRNGRFADDLAIRGIFWLFGQDRFDPLPNLLIVPTSGGGNVAVVSDEPHSPDWQNLLSAALKIPVKPKPSSTLSTPGKPSAPKPSQKPTIPDGEPLVTMSAGPDEVRVPNVTDRSVAEGEKLLNSFDLQLADAPRYFNDDKIRGSIPNAKNWVKAGSEVEIDAARRVPDLSRHSVNQASAEVARYRFQLVKPDLAATDDVVIQQSPSASSFASIGSNIEVKVGVIVPNVVNLQQKEADSQLKEKRLSWTTDTKSFQTDKVVSQSPVGGTLATIGESVRLELHLQVPNLVGQPLGRAQETASNYDLRSELTTPLARSEDVVRGQNPAAGSYVPHQSLMRLGPVVTTVPNLVGTSVRRATNELSDRDFRPQTQGDLLDSDLVTMQTPRAGTEVERGTAVTLDARVAVPNVRGQSITAAERMIRSSGGELQSRVDSGYEYSDVVYAQNPGAGLLVAPRTIVTLTPGVTIPNMHGTAPEAAYSALSSRNLPYTIRTGVEETSDRRLVGTVRIDGHTPGPGLYRRIDVGTVRLSAKQYILAERTVPNVIEMKVSAAISAVKAAGLTPVMMIDGHREMTEAQYAAEAIVAAIQGSGSGAKIYELTVSSQIPRAGERLPVGGKVQIIVYFPK